IVPRARADAADDKSHVRGIMDEDCLLLLCRSAKDADAVSVSPLQIFLDDRVGGLVLQVVRLVTRHHAHVAKTPLVKGAVIGAIALDGGEQLLRYDVLSHQTEMLSAAGVADLCSPRALAP